MKDFDASWTSLVITHKPQANESLSFLTLRELYVVLDKWCLQRSMLVRSCCLKLKFKIEQLLTV